MFDASRAAPSAAPRHRLQGLTLAWGLLLSCALAAGSARAQQLPTAALPAQAAASQSSAQPASDVVSRFLIERGILGQAANEGLLGQVRDKASELVLSSMNFLGVPYKRGGNSAESGFDCSGFTRHIFEMSVGLVLPRRADEQAKLSSLLPIKKDELKPGDLVFFNTMRRTFSHVGIYVGDGKFIHSPRAGGKVRVEDMRDAYWAKRFTGARRADLSADKGVSATALN
ncbi:C40 family peptidase [Roseateles sp.]|jgi:cell wall-associated NlpC family hydrolase|uniref:C40 family peptidase n=1 Tax=Roseateles sp. TaxID=1971397 RepID=UPI0039192B98